MDSHWIRRARSALLVLALPLLVPACTTSSAAAATSTRATASPSTCGVTRVVPVHGRLASVGGRTVARVEAFSTREEPALGGSMELYFAAYPTEEFDAFVTDVTPAGNHLATAEADLAHADGRLIPEMPFTAQMIVVTACPRRDEIRSRRNPFIGDM